MHTALVAASCLGGFVFLGFVCVHSARAFKKCKGDEAPFFKGLWRHSGVFSEDVGAVRGRNTKFAFEKFQRVQTAAPMFASPDITFCHIPLHCYSREHWCKSSMMNPFF